MTDDELRVLVREAIRRHLGRESSVSQGAASSPSPSPPWRQHASFGRFLALHKDERGACLIEPGVQCNHCGFCESYGH
jgi:hypothetical protein